jgi:23S rRNA (uracil1939-C5)-methyltransferase
MPTIRAQVSIDRLSKSGQGVGAYQGRSVFVDGALPREQVLVELEEIGKVLRGRLLEVISSSPSRRAPGCELSDRCGGCDWLHLDEAAQREAKLEIVLSALEHLAGIARTEVEVLPTSACQRQMGYRRRAVMHLRDGQLCLFGRRSHDSVSIRSCPALVPQLSDLPGLLGPKLSKLERDAQAVHLLASEEAASFAVLLSGPVRPVHLEICERAVRELRLQGAVLVPQDGPARIIGDPSLPEAPDSELALLRMRPDLFAQANVEGNAALRRSVSEILGARPGERILELYCGNGNLTFAIAAAGAEVVAVESSGASLELARRSGGSAGGRVRFIQGEANRVCEGLVGEGLSFDALVADPPRSGAPRIGGFAQRLDCSRVVYASCDPAALARDAQNLRACGFIPRSLQLIDMFPQTRHAEAVMGFASRQSR